MAVTTRDITLHTLWSTSTVQTAGFNSASINRDVLNGYNIVVTLSNQTTTSIVNMNLAASIDDVTYVDITDSTVTTAATGNFMWNVSVPFYQYVRLETTMTTAQVQMTITARSVRM